MGARASQALEVQSWSYEDVRDAVAAWWCQRDEAEAFSAVSPIAVTTLEAWQYLTRIPKPLLLLADGGLELTSEQVSAVITNGHRVLLRTNAGHQSWAWMPARTAAPRCARGGNEEMRHRL